MKNNENLVYDVDGLVIQLIDKLEFNVEYRSEQEMITDFINDFFDWNDLP